MLSFRSFFILCAFLEQKYFPKIEICYKKFQKCLATKKRSISLCPLDSGTTLAKHHRSVCGPHNSTTTSFPRTPREWWSRRWWTNSRLSTLSPRRFAPPGRVTKSLPCTCGLVKISKIRVKSVNVMEIISMQVKMTNFLAKSMEIFNHVMILASHRPNWANIFQINILA